MNISPNSYNPIKYAPAMKANEIQTKPKEKNNKTAIIAGSSLAAIAAIATGIYLYKTKNNSLQKKVKSEDVSGTIENVANDIANNVDNTIEKVTQNLSNKKETLKKLEEKIQAITREADEVDKEAAKVEAEVKEFMENTTMNLTIEEKQEKLNEFYLALDNIKLKTIRIKNEYFNATSEYEKIKQEVR